jgi:hypothetical protein
MDGLPTLPMFYKDSFAETLVDSFTCRRGVIDYLLIIGNNILYRNKPVNLISAS